MNSMMRCCWKEGSHEPRMRPNSIRVYTWNNRSITWFIIQYNGLNSQKSRSSLLLPIIFVMEHLMTKTGKKPQRRREKNTEFRIHNTVALRVVNDLSREALLYCVF